MVKNQGNQVNNNKQGLKILHISPRVPFPPSDGGAIGIYNIIYGLAAEGHEIHILSANTPKHYQEDGVLSEIAIQYNVDIDTEVKPWKAISNFFGSMPFNIERFISEKFSDKLKEILKEHSFDIIQFEGTYVAWYVHVVREFSSCPLVIRAHNIEYVIWERLAVNEKNLLRRFYYKMLAKRLKKFETVYYKKFNAVAAITFEDVERFRSMGVSGQHRIIPAGVILDKFKLNPSVRKKPFTLFILSALDWIPNQEALFWFIEKVWPGVIEAMPHLELHIAGKGTPLHFFELKVKNMFIHGYVEDASVFMQRYDLMLVPLLSGGGMRLKVIEGMSLGKCIISSSVGAEGIEYNNGKDIVICEKPAEWVRKIIEYFHDPEKFYPIEVNSRKLIQEIYDNKKVTRQYIELYKDLIGK
jgi:glycosyltransferase involved in cell wall biosynthesis